MGWVTRCGFCSCCALQPFVNASMKSTWLLGLSGTLLGASGSFQRALLAGLRGVPRGVRWRGPGVIAWGDQIPAQKKGTARARHAVARGNIQSPNKSAGRACFILENPELRSHNGVCYDRTLGASGMHAVGTMHVGHSHGRSPGALPAARRRSKAARAALENVRVRGLVCIVLETGRRKGAEEDPLVGSSSPDVPGLGVAHD